MVHTLAKLRDLASGNLSVRSSADVHAGDGVGQELQLNLAGDGFLRRARLFAEFLGPARGGFGARFVQVTHSGGAGAGLDLHLLWITSQVRREDAPSTRPVEHGQTLGQQRMAGVGRVKLASAEL